MRLPHRLLAVALIASTLVITGQGCRRSSEAERLANRPVELTIWRVFENEDALRPAMRAYRDLHPNVSFTYRQLRIEEYEDELLRAFAEGTGPDIFSVHNTWVGGYENLIQPLPRS